LRWRRRRRRRPPPLLPPTKPRWGVAGYMFGWVWRPPLAQSPTSPSTLLQTQNARKAAEKDAASTRQQLEHLSSELAAAQVRYQGRRGGLTVLCAGRSAALWVLALPGHDGMPGAAAPPRRPLALLLADAGVKACLAGTVCSPHASSRFTSHACSCPCPPLCLPLTTPTYTHAHQSPPGCSSGCTGRV
jgi:hypothetical protein